MELIFVLISPSQFGATALYFSAKNGHLGCIKALIEWDADVYCSLKVITVSYIFSFTQEVLKDHEVFANMLFSLKCYVSAFSFFHRIQSHFSIAVAGVYVRPRMTEQ